MSLCYGPLSYGSYRGEGGGGKQMSLDDIATSNQMNRFNQMWYIADGTSPRATHYDEKNYHICQTQRLCTLILHSV